MKTILLTNHYSSGPYEIVKSELPEGFQLMMLSENSQDAILELAPKADYILASGRVKIDKAVLEEASNLKMIQRTGVGLDSLDLEELKKREIPLYVNQGVNAQSVAEHTLLLMLAALRKLPIAHSNTVNGIWKKQAHGVTTRELAGKTIGMVGMGNIAKMLVKLLKSFGVVILYYDPYRLSEAQEKELGVTYSEFDDLLPKVDILSFHCALNDATRHMLNAEKIARLKDGSIVVNTARGPLIDTKALIAALKTGHVGFAGLDVHEEEPLKADNDIVNQENVILTPHIGGITYDSFHRMMHDAMRNIEMFDKGKFDEIETYRFK